MHTDRRGGRGGVPAIRVLYEIERLRRWNVSPVNYRLVKGGKKEKDNNEGRENPPLMPPRFHPLASILRADLQFFFFNSTTIRRKDENEKYVYIYISRVENEEREQGLKSSRKYELVTRRVKNISQIRVVSPFMRAWP